MIKKLPELLEAVCTHPDCPGWLQDAIWDAFGNQPLGITFTAAYWQGQFDSMKKANEDARKRTVGQRWPAEKDLPLN